MLLRDKKINIMEIIQWFLIVAIPIVTVSGWSAYPYALRAPLIYATAIVMLITIVCCNVKFSINYITVTAFLLMSYMIIQYFYSYDVKATQDILTWYLCVFTLLFIDAPNRCFEKILSVMFIICAVIAFSIIISVVINNCMLKYFSFIVNPSHSASVTEAITRELSSGYYSGFGREKGISAYIMNIGVAICFSRYFSQGKMTKSNLFFTILFIVSLMLTGKRMLLIVVVASFTIFIAISKVKNKMVKVFCVVVIVACAVLMILAFVPEMANVFYRFLDEENVESMGDREVLWKYLYMMIAQFPWFGGGLSSYTEFAYDNGLRVAGEKWSYLGHNSYLQVMAEMGLVGSILFGLLILFVLIATFSLLRKNIKNKSISYLLYFSLYNQILLLVYGISGNPIHTDSFMYCWFFCVGMTLCIGRHIKADRISENKSIRRGNRLWQRK